MVASRTQTLRTVACSGSPKRGQPRLRVLYTPDEAAAGRVFTLPVGRTWLGRELPRDKDGHSFTGDRAMSSLHGCLEVTESTLDVRLCDWGSKNGTQVDRTFLPQRDHWHELADGTVIRLGNTLLILRYEPAQPADAPIPTLIGVSLALRELRARIAKLAPEEAVCVLIQGESGTGKELVARALHDRSSRRDRPFVAVNCSAIAESLAESELFGHSEGAFTGARPRLGYFRAAHRGTLFLDEVGDMPLVLQPKLFRALQEHVITPVGADRPEPSDVRVLSATNQDLRADIDAGEFRPELYRRLAGVTLELPPLRQRQEDILPLLHHGYAGITRHLDAELVHDLLLYAWPENVGQLGNVAQQLRIEGVTESLRALLRQPPTKGVAARPIAGESVSTPTPPREVQRLTMPTAEALVLALQRHTGVVLRVAAELGCSRRQVQRWLQQYGLDANHFRRSS